MNEILLDFMIIGAQKAGTSSLAAYLNESPYVYIPPEKELPWFLDVREGKTWSEFMDAYFKGSLPNQLLGTSTPQYMMYPESLYQISKKMPNIKIITILRDPISRLISHYDMACRFGVESRTLNEVVRSQLSNVKDLRKTPYNDKTGKYLVSGEYGRIFEEFFQYFDQKQLLVLDFDHLKVDTQSVVDQMSSFLDVPKFYCKGVDIKRMSGGKARRMDVNHDAIIGKLVKFGKLLKLDLLFPDNVIRIPGLVSSWIDENNVKANSKSGVNEIEKNLLQLLKLHYANDLEKIDYLDTFSDIEWLSNYKS